MIEPKTIMECRAFHALYNMFKLFSYGHEMSDIVDEAFLDKLTEENNHVARKFFELALKNMDVLEKL